MRILVTGAGGFIARNLVQSLKNLRDGKDRTRDVRVEEIFEYRRGDGAEALAAYCRRADFVFHLAGVNRPDDPAQFQSGNAGLTASLLKTLRQAGNACPVMLASSIQAGGEGRWAGSEYGRSKREAEELVFSHARRTGASALVYRFPNVFGKWCRPNYNSVVATFCHNIARDLPVRVDDPATELELLYIDDLVAEMLDALEGRAHRDGEFCRAVTTHRVTLGQIVELLRRFHSQPETLLMPDIPASSFAKKLYSTYLSYLPAEKAVFPLKMNADARGSFTELMKTAGCGQFSVNISKPGVTKGQHWHHSKWELFIVVSGRGQIRMRKLGSDEVLSFDVSGERIEAVHMLPGYTHSIVNLSDTQELVTLMWANETFDPARPDTFYEEV